ncbi:MAG: fibrobacter succinogenes major paralogous domain-containing protein [Bacteroidota bacterium]
MKTRIFLLLVFTFLVSCNKDDTTNPTPNNSNEVTIGTQVWMKKNLDVDYYRNGDLIPQITDQTEWASLTTGAWCYYNNDSANGKIYGKLYNWYAVNDPRGLAPIGWHIPSDEEWHELENCLGGEDIAGSKLKEAGTAHWNIPNIGATNASSFTALPGGWRSFDGYRYSFFLDLGFSGYWWSSTERPLTISLNRYLDYHHTNLYEIDGRRYNGFSVRCIKD